jgi:hypothetical protein
MQCPQKREETSRESQFFWYLLIVAMFCTLLAGIIATTRCLRKAPDPCVKKPGPGPRLSDDPMLGLGSSLHATLLSPGLDLENPLLSIDREKDWPFGTQHAGLRALRGTPASAASEKGPSLQMVPPK